MSANEEWSESGMKNREAAMKRIFLAAIMVFLILSPIGCGHHDHGAQIIISFTISDPVFDGDISVNSANTTTITQGNTQSVFAGIDPVTNTEFRAFLDFPLTGPGGVPGNAVIDSAFLDIVISNIFLQSPDNTIPIRIELVSFQPPTLIATDFDRIAQPPITFTTIVPPISQADVGTHVSIEVTSLMIEAQRLGLADFQIRILEDLVFAPPGLIEINDTTTTAALRGNLAPQLQVNYF
jgi:hypothetical protein